MRHAREHQAWRMKVGGRAMRSPPHAATEAQNSKKRDRLRMVEVSLPKIIAKFVRLGDLEIKRQEGVQEECHAAQVNHRMQRVARGDVGQSGGCEQDDPGKVGRELEV
jgi:hypothetical protein